MAGGTTFHFVTDGVEAAYAQAVAVAGGRDISIAGGASCARQAIAAGLVDEIDLQVSAVLLGSGERLFTATREEFDLELVSSTSFDGGALGNVYRPKGRS